MKMQTISKLTLVFLIISCGTKSVKQFDKIKSTNNIENIQLTNLQNQKEIDELMIDGRESKLPIDQIGDFPPLAIPTSRNRERPLTIRDKKLVEEAIQQIQEKQKSKIQKENLHDQDVKDEHKQAKDLTINDLARIKNEIIKSLSLNQKLVSLVFKDERIKTEVIFLNLENTNILLSRLEIEKEDIKYKSMYCMNEAFKVALLQDIPLQISFNTSKSELIFETTSIGANCKN